MRVALLIRSLGCGGAERQLLLLAAYLSGKHKVVVYTFYNTKNHYLSDLGMLPFEIVSLGKHGRWDLISFLNRFRKEVTRFRPDVLYAFMSSAALVSLLLRLVDVSARIVWGIRSSNMDLKKYGLLPRLVRFLECKLSRFADLAIANSQAGKKEALDDGFSCDIKVIPNGIDIAKFAYDDNSRKQMRDLWGVNDDVPLIGTVARHDPMKGYEIFLQAAAKLLVREPNVRFVSVGDGPTDYTRRLRQFADDMGLRESMIWAGRIDKVASCYSAMDLYTSASMFGEGFSNAIGEAMACGLPCVVTDVGDSRYIVGHTGTVVTPGSPDELANGWSLLLERGRSHGQIDQNNPRSRIEANFGIQIMGEATSSILEELCKRCHHEN